MESMNGKHKEMKRRKNIYAVSGYLLAIVLLSGATTGCSDDGRSYPPDNREIVLQSLTAADPGVSEGTGNTSGLSAGDTLFFAKGTASGSYGDTWKARLEEAGRTKLLEMHYYPSDNSAIYLRGYRPAAASSAGNLLHYMLDGSQDLLLSGEQSGRLTDMFWQEAKSFRFEHLLTQLRFEVKADSTAREKGLALQLLEIAGSRPAAVLDTEKGELSFNGEPGLITVYSRKDDTEAIRPDTLFTAVPGRVTVEPGAGLFLTLRTRDAEGRETSYEHMPVVFHSAGGLSEAGVSYLLRVTLDSRTAPRLGAEVTPWGQGDNGNGIIQ